MSEPTGTGREGESLESMLPALSEDRAAPAREASVRLRADSGSGEQAINDMHAANESLAAAFRTMYRVLQLAIVGLVVIYGLSGFRTVSAGELGIAVFFGRPSAEPVVPGIVWTPPYPMGQLVRIQTGQRTEQLEGEFWFSVREADRTRSIEELAQAPQRSLNPERDGALITSDQNLVHTRWTVVYRRDDPRKFAESITPGDERDIVRAAVSRGVIQAVATTAIDDLLRETGTAGGVASRAQRVAQELLDTIGAGIVVENLVMSQRTPPLSVWSAFNEVQTAESTAQGALVRAESYATEQLNRVAGSAAKPLLDQITLYEQAVELGDLQAQEQILPRIHAILDGRSVEIDGEIQRFDVTGEVSKILNDAQQAAIEVEQSARRILALYRVKLPQYRENPDLVLRGDWARMMRTVLARETVEVMMVPTGPLHLLVNMDPDIRRRIEELERERMNLEALERRTRTLLEQQHRTDTEMRQFGG